MPPKTRNRNTGLTENERLYFNKQIEDFINNSKDETLVFPSTLRKIDRRYLHEYVPRFGLTPKSRTIDKERRITIYKKSKETPVEIHEYQLNKKSKQFFEQLDKQKKLPQLKAIPKLTNVWKTSESMMMSRPLSKCIPQQTLKIPTQFLEEKLQLPIYSYKQCILDAIQSSSVIIVNGETGSGKTTQVPQYILEENYLKQEPCRIICTQPRRVAAVSVSKRVSEERGEQLGSTVGYQIRLESCVSQYSNLIYTTSGCILRALTTNAKSTFSNISHLIIDEIHERDKNTDFILISVKKYLKTNTNLKVILMSATMDIGLLSNYFDNCPVIEVPGKTYEITTFYLEDILLHTQYKTSLMEKFYKSMEFDNVNKPQEQSNNHVMDASTQSIIDEAIDGACLKHDDYDSYFMQLLYLIKSENVPVDVCHSKSFKTPLFAAVECNDENFTHKFLQLGADKYLTDINGQSADSYARNHYDQKCVSILDKYNSKSANSENIIDEISVKKCMLLSSYQMQFNDDDEVDHDLIFSLIEGIYRRNYPGAIMVFFPGYSDIITQREYIESTLPHGTYELFILHSNMNTVDQQRALKRTMHRKIILSTNIGQTSITIPDLTFVIDSGKVKMKTYDSSLGQSQLSSVWISKACANQRSGRAGRTQNGVCYRLYSKKKYDSMTSFCLAEFLRISLAEICLFAKTLDPKASSEEYLSQALNAPPKLSIQNAVKMLKVMDIFDENECITDLGKHVVNIPFDVQLGKMLMYAIFFKCVRPVLTIVTFHSVKDPFILPSDRSELGKASVRRKTFSMDSFSDHMVILNLYNGYKKVYQNKKLLDDFCNQNYVSKDLMKIFNSTRSQVYEQISKTYDCSDDNSDDWNIIRMCLVGGLYPNIALIDRGTYKLISKVEYNLIINQGSALRPPGRKRLKEYINEVPNDFVAFFEKSILSNMGCINYNTLLPSIVIGLMYGHNYIKNAMDESDEEDENDDEDEDCKDNDDKNDNNDDNVNENNLNCTNQRSLMKLDEWLAFYLSKKDKEILSVFRELIKNRFWCFLKTDYRHENNSNFIQMLKKLLSIESPVERELAVCLNGTVNERKKYDLGRSNYNYNGRRNTWRSNSNNS